MSIDSYRPRNDNFRSLKAPARNEAAPDLDTLLNDLDPTVDEDGNDVDWDWMNNNH